MGKDGFLTPKAIANRIKAKGLQKLRWYCQMCEKQCRDENGFKNHCLTEGHKRQMQLFSQSSSNVLRENSRIFKNEFVKLLASRYNTRRVHINKVYNEYISDKSHMHMNATYWNSLTGLAMHLGSEGICHVEETEKGWFIQWIDNSPSALARREATERKFKSDAIDERRELNLLKHQIDCAHEISKSTSNDTSDAPSSSQLLPESEKLVLKPTSITHSSVASLPNINVFGDDDDADDKKPALVHSWLIEGIVVKIVSKSIYEGRLFGAKGVIRHIHNQCVAELQLIDGGGNVNIDQRDLETVIPSLGGIVLFVRGPNRGKKAILESINSGNYCAALRLLGSNELLKGIDYEDFSKIAS